jgi:peptidyl-dipeptidase A
VRRREVTRCRFSFSALALVIGTAACRVLAPAPTPGAADVTSFLAGVNDTMLRLGQEQQRAGWVQATYITPDTEAINARANQAYIDAVAGNAKDAAKFSSVTVSPDARRQLDLLKVALVVVTPGDAKEAEELTRLTAAMEAAYGRGKWCPDPSKPEGCLDIEAITDVMANSRDPKRLREVWEGWHTISVPLRKDFARFVELANTGARELGFADTGALWRAKYDMPPDAFPKELNRLWDQVRPLYVSLHAYVRMKLRATYGDAVPASGPIPAYLLGNIWAQDWSNVYRLVAPKQADPGYSLTAILKQRQVGAVEMVRTGERFFTSLGFAPLPGTFWERSLFVKPRDRDVVCHASAWAINLADDLRIKMCIDPTEEDFTTIHHELGHNFYQRAYKDLPTLYRDSANDGFHEAVGDTIALSVTPEYLVRIGLLDKAPDASRDIGLLMSRALEKIAFLPFGLLVDEWRWQVFSGQVPPDRYNEAWWALRQRYQGVAPPAPRGEEFFDPGAKYHVPAVTPYARYFLAAILQFQFHRALAQTAGCTAPLHRCSIYENKDAGRRLDAMLKLGISKPWPDALEALTGSRAMDATAIRDYFAPLQRWLDEQLKGQPVGW